MHSALSEGVRVSLFVVRRVMMLLQGALLMLVLCAVSAVVSLVEAIRVLVGRLCTAGLLLPVASGALETDSTIVQSYVHRMHSDDTKATLQLCTNLYIAT